MERPEAARTGRIRVAPGSLPATVRLRGGNAIVIRRVEPADTPALQRFFRDLSPASRYRRFLRVIRDLPEDLLARFTQPDSREVVLVAALAHFPARIVGVAQLAGTDDVDGSELAVVVSDAWQRKGLGGQLLDALMKDAIAAGIDRLHADILADNHAMRRLAQNFGFKLVAHPAGPFLVRAEKTLAKTEPTYTDASRHPKVVSTHLRPRALPLTDAEQPPRAEAGL